MARPRKLGNTSFNDLWNMYLRRVQCIIENGQNDGDMLEDSFRYFKNG